MKIFPDEVVKLFISFEIVCWNKGESSILELDQNPLLKTPSQVTWLKLSNSQAHQTLSSPLLDLSRRLNFQSLLMKTSELLDILLEVEAEFQDILIKKPSGYSKTIEKYQEPKTVWKTRMETKEREFEQQRRYLFERIQEKTLYVDFLAPSLTLTVILPFWQTNLYSQYIEEKPTTGLCSNLALEHCGLPKVADITKECRFDFNTTEFVSSVCNASHLATNEEYMCSGYWPGSSSNNSSFIEEDLLCLWYHLRHKTPGTSERKLIKSLQEISFDNDRVNIFTCVVLEQEQTNTTSDDLNSKQWFNSNKRDNHYQKLEKRLKTSWETRELLLRSPAPGAHPMATHLTQIRGSVLYRRANYSPSGLHICVSFLERTSPDSFFTTIAALSKERMTHLCEEITNLPCHPRQYYKPHVFQTCPKGV
ncbi:hypothetical protein OUZ56_012499 [Daphnia magna]|uniref:CxC3 like cysteine cluster domain-containing protein n=1 Tax=Daphnia magna TaxID=35525 RepID=A0ABQ9Z365_9CRUS|nr:hypothetical protein OUZ56_012499 [Daphnia magna]